MWKLEQIKAENFSAFKTLKYTLEQGHATLIFGNNMDNDSQKSNGSGKSALIEAIAVGLTGSTLRNIKTEEIINDNAEEATISLKLSNDFLLEDITIWRRLSRKDPQEIQISRMDYHKENGSIATPEKIVQSSVADYNKYILDLIGLTKDDIYSNFILCKHKYQSFLSSSDKEKKEIINRFSNGIMVDESIAALQEDMKPIEERLTKATSDADVATGKVSAIEEQIQEAIDQSAQKSENKARRIQEWKDSIAERREYIRAQYKAISDNNDFLDVLDKVYVILQKLESNKKLGVKDAYQKIVELFVQNNIEGFSNYEAKLADSEASLAKLENLSSERSKDCQRVQEQLQEANKKHAELKVEYDAFVEDYNTKLPEIEEKLKDLLKVAENLAKNTSEYEKKRDFFKKRIAEIENQLAGGYYLPEMSA